MTPMEQRYQRAEQLLDWNLSRKFKNLAVDPHWLDEFRFWFKRDLCDRQEGSEFILVDTENLSQKPAFDHQHLAVALSELFNQTFNAWQLPVEIIELTECCAKNQLSLVIDHET